MDVAVAWTKRSHKAADQSLIGSSWFDVHKVLAADGLAPNSAMGMRAVQMAIERLVKTKLITVQDGKMTITDDMQTEEELEQLLFPEEFVSVPAPAEEDED